MNASALDISAVDPETRNSMFALMSTWFAGITRPVFDRDLDAKTRVILLYGHRGTLAGFTSYAESIETDADDRPCRVVYSGDTIVDPHSWGSMAMPRAWLSDMTTRAWCDDLPTYWLLITSGYRTYRFLPVFLHTYYPSVRPERTPALRRLRAAVAQRRWGSAFDAETGIVRFEHPQRLVPALAQVRAERCDDPHVQAYLEWNPGHANGDELVSIAPLEPANLTRAGSRFVKPAHLAVRQ
jgi:hypothetical protein